MEPDRPTTTGFRHAPEPSRNRARQVRSARRHSLVVRFLRVALPVSAIAIFGYYGATLLEVAGWSNPVAKIAIPKVLPEHLTMSNPRYQGYTKDGGNYTFEAKTARQDLKTPTFVHLNGVTGTLLQADNAATRLSAARGTYDARRQVATLVGAIRINADDGGWARLVSATITPRDGIIASKLPVAVGNKSGVIRAKAMTVRQKTKEITFNGDVHARLAPAEGVIGDIDGKGNLRITPSKKPAPEKNIRQAEPDAAKDDTGAGAMARLFQGGDNSPIEIAAERLDVDDVKRTATFTGGVTVTRGAARLTSPELRIAYDGSPSGGLAGGSKPVAQGGAGGVRSSIKTIVATGPVVITEGEATRVTGATALYDAASARATIDGGVVIDRAPATRVTAALATFDTARDIASLDSNVVMSQGADRRVTGDHAELHNKDGTALVTGNVVMTQGTNVLRGRRLTLDQKAGRSQLTASASDGGAGRISAQFAPNAAKGGKASPPASPGAGGNPLGGLLSTASFRTDPNAPIGIVAERLDVDDKSGEAVFRGDVVATQGEVSLRSSEVHARYSGSAGLSGGGGDQTEKVAQAPVQLAKIQAKGSVIVTSKAGQKATGDWADFNTAANTVTLGGDVVLTQGRNVVRGSRLDIDLATGEAVLTSDNAAAPEVSAEQAGGGWKASRQPSRPRAVFFPQDLRGEGVGKPAALNSRASPPAVDGWSSTTNDGPRPAADN